MKLKAGFLSVLAAVLIVSVLHVVGDQFFAYGHAKSYDPRKVVCVVSRQNAGTCEEKKMDPAACEHKETYSSVVVKATCKEEGERAVVCALCSKVIEKESIDKADCSYGNWVYTKTATPVSNGERYKQCEDCGRKKVEPIEFLMPGENSIYIPGTGIHHEFTVASYDQESVDRFDIVYTNETGSQDPFVLGHDTGTMQKLRNTKVGQLIYISVNSVIETYKVIVSEYAVQDRAQKDIIGKTTGTNIWDSYKGKTLHLYTCHGLNDNGRWIVLARKVN